MWLDTLLCIEITQCYNNIIVWPKVDPFCNYYWNHSVLVWSKVNPFQLTLAGEFSIEQCITGTCFAISTYIHVIVATCTCIIYVYVHTYIHTYIHTYMYIYTCIYSIYTYMHIMYVYRWCVLFPTHIQIHVIRCIYKYNYNCIIIMYMYVYIYCISINLSILL